MCRLFPAIVTGSAFDRDHIEEVEIRALADALYHRVEWTWTQVRMPTINHGWTPETGFLSHAWDGYNEAMILYLLALGSPTFSVDDSAWKNDWKRFPCASSDIPMP